MNRNDVVNEIMCIARGLSVVYDKEQENECFRLANDYNNANTDNIFCSEIDGGIVIEDDVFYFVN